MVDPPNRLALERERDRAIALLSQRFADGFLDADELDERMERAQTASSPEALRELTVDLEDPDAAEPEATALSPFSGAPPVPGRPPPAVVALVPADQVRDYQRSVAIFGEAKQTGTWVPPRILTSLTALGDTELDFREAQMGPGVTEVEIQAFLGDVDIIVPPGLAVEVGCHAILASLKTDDEVGSVGTPIDPAAPRLRITGFAVLADVEVVCRLPGETKRDAKRRKKAERKALKAASKGRS